MKTIKEIVDAFKTKSHIDYDATALGRNLYGKLWEAMLTVSVPTQREVDGKFHSVLCDPNDAAMTAENLVVAWWNKKEGIVDGAD